MDPFMESFGFSRSYTDSNLLKTGGRISYSNEQTGDHVIFKHSLLFVNFELKHKGQLDDLKSLALKNSAQH
ncbi:hypothetical protein Back11_26640 [Paenibacillus baekrokdamisoli]|uniref:Uncharacterized protein n=1 Tax=Paenibacillus baekrokdamisoli TaxID=1712516 RepID=A0A3G9JEA3_9BACL|nr:hypothetical protein [Paenibacillus baekrokdamisoli]MBB3070314.1 hypothetical protein [Paenibacillus baekrokdamisoli]BBH21319.1 hypothetical protein Back11_26640 [Paenibacillus baekrokdamisoli]